MWEDLKRQTGVTKNSSKAVLGSFHDIRSLREKRGGAVFLKAHSDDLNQCRYHSQLQDLRYLGPFFTSCYSSEGERRLDCKLDRVLVNDNWGDILPKPLAVFKPKVSWITLLVLLSGKLKRRRGKRHLNSSTFGQKHENFLPLVREAWSEKINGIPMYKVISKLKNF